MGERSCATCYWWRSSDAQEGVCALASSGGVTAERAEHPASLARAQGDHGYGALLVTSRNFSCNQWLVLAEERTDKAAVQGLE